MTVGRYFSVSQQLPPNPSPAKRLLRNYSLLWRLRARMRAGITHPHVMMSVGERPYSNPAM